MEKLTLNATSVSINVGETYKLQAAISPAEATDNLVWSSGNTAVATVSNGIVTGEAAGVTTITVKSSNGKTANCTVTVTDSVVIAESVSLNKYSLNLEKGETEQLQATIEPSNVTDNFVVWSSADVSVATVDQNGTVEAVNDGKVTITVSTANGKKTSSNASNGTKYWVEGFIAISSDYDSMVLAGGIAGHSSKSGNISGENFADEIQATGNELIAIIQQDPFVAFCID